MVPASTIESAPVLAVPPVAITSKWVGSSRQIPIAPCNARVLTLVPGATCNAFPEVSIKPPLPPFTPPSAESLASTKVRSALARIDPPCPIAPASTLICPAKVNEPGAVARGVGEAVR